MQIQVEGLFKRYPRTTDLLKLLASPLRRETVTALEDVDLRFESGHIYGIVGHNGAGKTTLLKILAGLVLPTEGAVRIDGEEVDGRPARLRREIGFVVADERTFFWRLSVGENLRFFATLQRIPPRERGPRVAAALERVGLSGKEGREFRSLSTGMRQRLAIARGLLVDPLALLMDEPTRSLDPESARRVRELVRSIIRDAPDRLLLYSSHNVAEVQEVCTDVVVLRAGKVALAQPMRADGALAGYEIETRRPLEDSELEALEALGCTRASERILHLRLSGDGALEDLLERLIALEAGIVRVEPLPAFLEQVYERGQEGAP